MAQKQQTPSKRSLGKSRLKPKPKADLRSRCLTAALGALREGERGFSLRDIARRLGVSHGAPYRHFPTKESLLMALCEDGFRRFAQALVQGWSEGTDPEDRMVRMGYAYLQFALANQEQYFMMFNERMGSSSRPALDGVAGEAFGILVKAVSELATDPAQDQKAFIEKSVFVWSYSHGLAMLMIHGQLNFTGISSDISLARFRALSAPMLKTL